MLERSGCRAIVTPASVAPGRLVAWSLAGRAPGHSSGNRPAVKAIRSASDRLRVFSLFIRLAR